MSQPEGFSQRYLIPKAIKQIEVTRYFFSLSWIYG